MRGSRRLLAAAVSLLAPLLGPTAASASGFYVPDTGTVARSRGGAFCVSADDPLAMRYNPAGLADQHERALLVDVTSLWLTEKFERTGIPADSVAPSSATSHPPAQIIPALIYVQPIGSRFSLAAGLHAPAGPRFAFKKGGPQRFTHDSLYNTEASYGVAGAYRIHRMVSAGLSLEGILAGVQQTIQISGQGPGNPPTEDPLYDRAQVLDVEDSFTPSFTAGVKITPVPAIEIGMSYRPEAKINAPGTLADKFTNSTEKVHFHFTLPMMARLGVRYVQPAWDAEVDLVVEDWSAHDVETLVADDGNFIESDRSTVIRDFGAGYSVRAGGSWAATPTLKVHGGVYYETSCVPDARIDVGTIDSGKEGLNAGVSWAAGKRFVLSGNVSATFLQPVKVTNSKNRQVTPFPVTRPESELSIVGNGTYSGMYQFVGISLLTKL